MKMMMLMIKCIFYSNFLCLITKFLFSICAGECGVLREKNYLCFPFKFSYIHTCLADGWEAPDKPNLMKECKNYERKFMDGKELGKFSQLQLQDVVLKHCLCSKNFVIANMWIWPKFVTQVAYVCSMDKETIDVNWKSQFIKLCNTMGPEWSCCETPEDNTFPLLSYKMLQSPE